MDLEPDAEAPVQGPPGNGDGAAADSVAQPEGPAGMAYSARSAAATHSPAEAVSSSIVQLQIIVHHRLFAWPAHWSPIAQV